MNLNFGIKFKTITIISIIFLSTFIVSWNFNIEAKSLDIEKTSTSTSRSNNYPRDANFDLGAIDVISESVPGFNLNPGHSSNPSIAIENDKTFVVWMDRTDYDNSGKDLDIFYRCFDGNKWSEIQIISEPIFGQNLNTGESFKPKIAVENGKVFVVWYDHNNTMGAGSDDDIFFRCNLTGTGWEDIQVISEPVSGENFNIQYSLNPDIAVNNGKIFVVWSDSNNTNYAGTDFDIFYRSNLTGSSWEDIQVISEPFQNQDFNRDISSSSSIAVENDKIYVVWHDISDINSAGGDADIFLRCNLNGSNWEPLQVISEPEPYKNLNKGDSQEPALDVENGMIYIVWQDNNDTNDTGIDWDIFYRCNLTGSSWEPIQVISEPILKMDLNIQSSMNPEIEVEYNMIYIVWKDNNNTNNVGLDTDIFFRCNLTGLYWEPIQIISEPKVYNDINTEISGVPTIAGSRGKYHMVWHDENNTNECGTDYDIFYRQISLPMILGQPRVTPTSGNTSTIFNFMVTYYQFDDENPNKITVNINSIEYSMLEVDQIDVTYVNGKEYFLNIKNLDIKTHKYHFYASDGIDIIFTRPFKKPIVYNTPPIITTKNNISAFEDDYYKIDYEYEDMDVKNVDQNTYWNFSSNASWLKFNHLTGVLNGTPTNEDVGEYWINISMGDTMESDSTNFTITVININDAPVINSKDIKIALEDEHYDVFYKAFDVDTIQRNLIWTLNTNATWLKFEPFTTMLNGIPTNDNVGKSWVNISVSDGEYIDYSNFTLKVINVNDPPRIITEDIIITAEDEYYEVDYEVIDVDNTYDELFWNITTNAKWLMYNTSNSIINGTPSNDDVGEYWVRISVSDTEYFDNTNFTLTVKNINDPPIIITKNVNKAIVGQLFSVNYEVIDIDPINDKITWKLETNANEWLNIDSITGWLNGEPSDSDIGKYWVNISVNDGKGGLDYQNFTFIVESIKESNSKEKSSWLWFIWVIIIVIVIILVMILILYKKRKAPEIPSVRAELIHAPSIKPLVLPSGTLTVKGVGPLPSPQIGSEQLPAPTPGQTLYQLPRATQLPAPTPGQTLYQLPRATLSKVQKLELLEERFLRGEVTEETYLKLRFEIEKTTNMDITND